MVKESVIEEIQNARFDVDSVDPDPYQQFRNWYDDALRAEVLQPDAMHLATLGPLGEPTGRYVLYKDPKRYGLSVEGYLFFTDYRSPKSKGIGRSPHVAVTFYWKELGRQVRIKGTAEKVSQQISDQYFETRAEGSKLGAWSSYQSEVIASRSALEDRVELNRKKFAGKPVPRPEHWGGFLVRPIEMEFWQHRDDRLHDRVWYEPRKDGGWVRRRLSP